jgi:two-component system, OmpR family, sensor kinase
MRLRISLALLPAALAGAGWFFIRQYVSPPRVLSIRIEIGLLLFISGLLITILILSILFTGRRLAGLQRSVMGREKARYAESQRRFLRRLDHELKNPLTGIRAALANLEDSVQPESTPTALPEIRRQTERLTRLTAGLRKLADLEEIELENQPVHIGELLQEVVEAVRTHPVGAGRDLRLVVPSVPWPLPPVMGDYDLLNLAFFNLVQNALKFSGKPDTVEVRAAEHGHQVQVEIADTGPGIPAEDLPRVFEELFRGSNARGSEGSGLGLAMVQRVVERHGGTVSVRSRREGTHGTVFTVTLPLSQAAPIAGTPPAARLPGSRPEGPTPSA